MLLKVLLVIGVVIGFGLFVMYNHKIMTMLGVYRKRSESIFYRVLGKRIKKWNEDIERITSIKKDTLTYRINAYFKEIIVNLDMEKDNVTPIGLITFIVSVSFSFAFIFAVWSGEVLLSIPAFAAIFYFIVVIFRFMSLMAYEKKEAEIMDTEDLLAMDVKGGVYNAILRYRKSFHPNMKPYFEEFIDNIQHKGYSFREAMLVLNDRLGQNFTDFAQKAILYEEKADKDMDDIFSSIVEINRYRRTLRYENNKKFNQLRLEFILSMCVIGGYVIFSMISDPFLANFFKNTLFGKLLLLGDIVIITAVLAYLSSIKAKL